MIAKILAFNWPPLAGILACINENWTHPLWKVFKWTEFALSYVLPIVLSVVLYTKICRVLWARNQFLHKGDAVDFSFLLFFKYFYLQIVV